MENKGNADLKNERKPWDEPAQGEGSLSPPPDVLARNRAVALKDRQKVFSIFIQIFFIIGLALLIFLYLANLKRYRPVSDKPMQNEGFIAVSYFGVEKYDSGSRTLIDQARLIEHLDILSKNGYTTISQRQIDDFYNEGALLPERSMFLMFENGRRDTAVYVHDSLKKYNFLATTMTYAEKFEMRDNKFLTAKDISTLMKSSYWEHGTNGYRLEYINVFDRYRNFFGHLNSDEFKAVSPYVDNDYNHYLMDFFRDEDRINAESLDEMQKRVADDYQSMEYVYNKYFGNIPGMYTIMHSNTGRFGTDPYVSSANEELIKGLYTLNVNREGNCMNARDISVYDLTRIEPQPHWYSNHLIMRIKNATGEPLVFVTGDEKEAAKWNVSLGAAEFRGDTVVLTCEPGGYGIMALPQAMPETLEISVRLLGNVAGIQGIGLCSDKSMENNILVAVENNILSVYQIRNRIPISLYGLDLFEFDGGPAQSTEENEKEGMLAYGNAVIKFSDENEKLRKAYLTLDEWTDKEVRSIGEGGTGYVPAISQLDRGDRRLTVALDGNYLTLSVDGRVAIRNLEVMGGEGYIYLQSKTLIDDLNIKNFTYDNVYDAVFSGLKITGPNADTAYYEYGLEVQWSLLKWFKGIFENIVSFFLDSF